MDCRKGSEFLRDLKAEGSRPRQPSLMSLEPEEPRSPWLIGPRGAHASAVERSEYKMRIAPKDCRWAGFAND